MRVEWAPSGTGVLRVGGGGEWGRGGGGQIRWTGVGWEVERRRGIRVLIL